MTTRQLTYVCPTVVKYYRKLLKQCGVNAIVRCMYNRGYTQAQVRRVLG